MKKEELFNLLDYKNEERQQYEFDDEIIVRTKEFVKKAHGDVCDKAGELYYHHPYRVCTKLMERYCNSRLHTEKQVNYACVLALLHDVVEDTEYTPDDVCKELGLEGELAEELKYGLSFITHDKNEPYSLYIKKIAECPIVYPAWVKMCDLDDNASVNRMLSTGGLFLNGEDTNRINKYFISYRILEQREKCCNATFKCNDMEIALIDNFMTPGERKRLEKLSKEQ